jgi:hypothetical protein
MDVARIDSTFVVQPRDTLFLRLVSEDSQTYIAAYLDMFICLDLEPCFFRQCNLTMSPLPQTAYLRLGSGKRLSKYQRTISMHTPPST